MLLSYFVKPDTIQESPNELSGINLDDETIWLGSKNIFIGSATREILEFLLKDDKKSFIQKVKIAYCDFALCPSTEVTTWKQTPLVCLSNWPDCTWNQNFRRV